MKNLPLGMNTLRKLLGSNCVYVDKTAMAWELVRIPGAYFLSRPRRFGKSLFVDTLKEIFEGNKELFEGLYIHDKWDWTKTYPVIKIDFAGGNIRSREELDVKIGEILNKEMNRLGVCSDKKSISGIFSDLIGHVTEKYGLRAVVLVDEYDKPILDNIDHPEIAAEMRDGLKNLYSVLKEQDANLQFVFLTGVSKSSKVSLFSGLNQLEDLTLDARYSSICGYTHDDLRRSFSEHLAGVDWDKLKRWYDGYKWLGDTSVYNPYDVLLFISKGQSYRNYWFETGSPSFLVELFRRKAYFLPDLENVKVTEEILDSFDIENINPLTLLFQTGYLTVAEAVTQRERLMFQLRIPNFEVKTALSDQLINGYTELVNEKIAIQDQLYACFKDADMAGIRCVIGRLFAGIPYRNFTNNELLRSEGYYASVLYAFFCSLNAEIIPEDVTSHGQVDLTIKLESKIYVMEIKVVDTAEVEGNPALDQIKRRGYSEKYNGSPNRDVYQVGLIFSCSTRNLIKFDGLEI